MDVNRTLTGVLLWLMSAGIIQAEPAAPESDLMRLPEVGSSELRIIAPTVLELTLVTTKKPDPARVEQWDFVDGSGKPRLPESSGFKVMVNGKPAAVKTVGFRRRVLYAPFRKRDLRIGNYLYLILSDPIQENATVEVTNPGNKLWQSGVKFLAKVDPFRWCPALHVNQTGYFPAYSKKAMVGYYLGSLGELDIGNPLDSAKVDPPPGATQPKSLEFAILAARTYREVFRSALKPRPFTSMTRWRGPSPEPRHSGFIISAVKQRTSYRLPDLHTVHAIRRRPKCPTCRRDMPPPTIHWQRRRQISKTIPDTRRHN
jgi:hypothetical protein